MKVLYFMNHADQGGAVLALYDLLVSLKKMENMKLVVITGRKNKFNEMLDQIGIENYSAPYKNFISSYKKPKFLFTIILWIRYMLSKPFAIKKIEELISFKDIDIIHTNLDRIDIGAYFSKKYNIPHVWHIREHLDDDFEVTSIFLNYIKHMEKYNSTYIAISKSVEQKWIQRGITKEKIKLIYDGIPTEKFINLEKKEKTDRCRILFLGGYYKNKGQELLVDALHLLSPNMKERIQVDFYGNGDKTYKQYLQKKIDQYGLKQFVTLHSYNSNIYEQLHNYDIGINCSKAEGFGRITVEYMLAGLCTIVSNTGANIELIEDGTTGILFKYEDEADLKNKLENIINDSKKMQELANNAKKRANEQFNIMKHAIEIKKIYRELIGSKK